MGFNSDNRDISGADEKFAKRLGNADDKDHQRTKEALKAKINPKLAELIDDATVNLARANDASDVRAVARSALQARPRGRPVEGR